MNCPKCKSEIIDVTVENTTEYTMMCKCMSCGLQFHYTAEIPFCKGCAFYSCYSCKHPLATRVNTVTGELSYLPAGVMRFNWRYCKTEALLFKPKTKSIIHRIIAWIKGDK